MDAKRYRQIRQLFDAVMEQPAAERTAYLAEAAKGDTALGDQVRHLLAASDNGTEVFDRPAIIRDGSGPLERWEGRHLGPYQILRELGEGGMGIVYLARRADGAFQKEVAIKIVRQDLATPQFLQRFQRERDILAKLEHPHIARLLDGGTSPAFLAMEYVKGEPLLAFADSRKLTFDARLDLLRQIASAVDYAHRQGVIHRDLKPANIFVTSDGDVKLLDFGIAAWQQGERESELSPTLAMSPAYASPEQIRGDKTNYATDIYSLGLIAYELMAGVQPFQLKKTAVAEILRTVLEETPLTPSLAVRDSTDPRPAELSRRRQMAPVELIERLQHADGTLLKAVSKRREDRPSSASELMDGLTDRNANPPKPLPPWILTLRRNLDLILFESAFLWLVATGHLKLEPVAWFVFAILSFFVISQRFGLAARWYKLNPALTSMSLLLIVGLGGWIASAPTDSPKDQAAKAVNLVMLVSVPLVIFHVLRYVRRSKELGELLVRSAKTRQYNRIVLIAAVVHLIGQAVGIYEGTSPGEVLRRLSYLVVIFGIAGSGQLPFEVREKGLVVGGNVVPWGAIRDYRWISDAELHLTFQESSTYMYVAKEMRAKIEPDEHGRVQEILQDWLLESPKDAKFASL